MGIVLCVMMGFICTSGTVKAVLVGVPSAHQLIVVQLVSVQNGFIMAFVALQNVQPVTPTNATAAKTVSSYKTEPVWLAHQAVHPVKTVPAQSPVHPTATPVSQVQPVPHANLDTIFKMDSVLFVTQDALNVQAKIPVQVVFPLSSQLPTIVVLQGVPAVTNVIALLAAQDYS